MTTIDPQQNSPQATAATSTSSTRLNGFQKLLVWLASGISIVAALSFLTLVIGMLNGIGREELATGFWASLGLITWLGFPTAIALIVVYVVSISMKNAKANRHQGLS